MFRKVLVLLLLLIFTVGSLFAVAPGSWTSVSLGYGGSSNAEMGTNGSALGLDGSWIGFPGRSWLGWESRFGVSLSLDPTASYLNMYVFIGPALSVSLTEGILAYVAAGPSYAFVLYDSPSAIVNELGIGIDLGARFRVAGSEKWDLALIAGAYGNAALSFSLFSGNGGGSSMSVLGYIGLSMGSGFHIPPTWPDL